MLILSHVLHLKVTASIFIHPFDFLRVARRRASPKCRFQLVVLGVVHALSFGLDMFTVDQLGVFEGNVCFIAAFCRVGV